MRARPNNKSEGEMIFCLNTKRLDDLYSGRAPLRCYWGFLLRPSAQEVTDRRRKVAQGPWMEENAPIPGSHVLEWGCGGAEEARASSGTKRLVTNGRRAHVAADLYESNL